MKLSYNNLVTLCNNEESPLVTDMASKNQIQPASVDVRLGNNIIVELPPGHHEIRDPSRMVVDVEGKDNYRQRVIDLNEVGYYDLRPGEFILATTMEWVNIPNDLVGDFSLNSSSARVGMNHLLACHLDPGFYGRVTLELKNSLRHHTLRLRPGMKIGQLKFDTCEEVPDTASYASVGQYNGQSDVQPTKGLRSHSVQINNHIEVEEHVDRLVDDIIEELGYTSDIVREGIITNLTIRLSLAIGGSVDTDEVVQEILELYKDESC